MASRYFYTELSQFLNREKKTRAQFARDVDVNIRTVFYWLAGRSTPYYKTALKIKKLSGIPLEVIFSRKFY